MKLAFAQINAFLQKPDPAVRVVLFYGPDTGLVRERADTLAKKTVPDINDPFSTASLSAASISEDQARLHDEMAAQAFGGGRRLVRIQQATEGLAASLAALLKDMPASDSFLLIEAGDLEKRSKLRAICENENLAAAIPCYIEEGAARQRIVADILQTEGLKLSRDALAFLSDILPPDRLAMRSELEKLAMYVGKTSTAVTIEDVQAVVQDAGAAELDDLIFAVGSGDSKRVCLLLERLLAEQTAPVAILRAAQRHFLRLQWARHQMDTGINAGEAVKRLQPPVFWKHTETMANQLRRWPANKIELVLTRLFEVEAAVKRTGTPDQAVCAQLLLQMAS
jgi:DNA polymerase-3 subunit delta